MACLNKYKIESAPGYTADKYGNIYGKSGALMSPKVRKDGYLQLALRVNGKYSDRLVHRLVAEVLYGESKLPVNHKNGVKSDNSFVNLEYVTHSENQLHSSRVLRNKVKPACLQKNGIGFWWPSYQQCSEDTGVPRLSVSLIMRGVYKQSKCGWAL